MTRGDRGRAVRVDAESREHDVHRGIAAEHPVLPSRTHQKSAVGMSI
jgi:hypothetical protein